jgi:hypothetical protein
METTPKATGTPTIRCEIGLAGIPRSEAVSAEARDYGPAGATRPSITEGRRK